MTIENHTASVTLGEIFATKGFEDDFRHLLIELCYDGEDPLYRSVAVKSYRLVRANPGHGTGASGSDGSGTIQFDVTFEVPEIKEYEVILSNTFEATSPEDAVRQMLDYLGSQPANRLGFRINFEDPEGLPGMTKTVFIDADGTRS